MPSNLELKARCPSISTARRVVRHLGALPGGLLHQKDSYFNGVSGRLKIREFGDSTGELIFYTRPDHRGDRYSLYQVEPISNPAKLKNLLTKAYGIKIIISKKRELYFLKNARIHLDIVRGLGSFIEFEVLVLHGRKQAELLMKTLRTEFGIHDIDLIGESYSDLLLAKKG